ncbi:MAG: hypothetical protein ACXVGR_16270 [Mycobacteriaceae bacterium]
MRSRRSVIGAIVVAVCIIGVALAAQTVLGGRDPNTIHAPGSLPDRISVCGRDWTRDSSSRQVTLEKARTMKPGGGPVVVAIGPFAPCPSGACTDTGGGPCDTVVWVRVGSDAYIGYELSGGP